MGRIELRNALSRQHRANTRRDKIKEGRKYWESLKSYSEGYGEEPSVFVDVQQFQKDWLARGRRCMLDWYQKIDDERDAIIAKREARRQKEQPMLPAAPRPNLWERFTDWAWSLLKIDIVHND